MIRNGLLTLYDTSMVNGIRHITVGPALQVKLSDGVRFTIDTNGTNTKDSASVSAGHVELRSRNRKRNKNTPTKSPAYMGSMRGDKSESGYFLLGYCKVNKNLRFRNMNPKKICTDGRKHHTTLAPCPSPESKIMESIAGRPTIGDRINQTPKPFISI